MTVLIETLKQLQAENKINFFNENNAIEIYVKGRNHVGRRCNVMILVLTDNFDICGYDVKQETPNGDYTKIKNFQASELDIAELLGAAELYTQIAKEEKKAPEQPKKIQRALIELQETQQITNEIARCNAPEVMVAVLEVNEVTGDAWLTGDIVSKAVFKDDYGNKGDGYNSFDFCTFEQMKTRCNELHAYWISIK